MTQRDTLNVKLSNSQLNKLNRKYTGVIFKSFLKWD